MKLQKILLRHIRNQFVNFQNILDNNGRHYGLCPKNLILWIQNLIFRYVINKFLVLKLGKQY